MAGLNSVPLIGNFAVPAVCLLIAFLGYFSQLILHRCTLDPGPPSRTESVVFNILLLCLWFCYFKTVLVDPGCYALHENVTELDGSWCRKCAAPKPPRAHHCRLCARCIPKMDHHCPWTRNCVSMTTFPHFLRFLVYANLSLWALGRMLWLRFHALWQVRHLPAYLGPSLGALIALATTSLVCFCTAFALGIMLIASIRTWLFNCTMIEGWELDRHEAVMDRRWRDSLDMVLPGVNKARVERVEFPYDIGLFSNMAQAMGTCNILLWLFPFSGNPQVADDGQGIGWTWEENGFNRKEGMWPPQDPDKIRRVAAPWHASRLQQEAQLQDEHLSPEQRKQAFRERQDLDEERKRLLLQELEEFDDYGLDITRDRHKHQSTAWINSDGERLHDYGVDEETEDADAPTSRKGGRDSDEDLPLAELLRRRRVNQEDRVASLDEQGRDLSHG
ncbi:Palmitoyltransferase PFA4 [Ophiocordyceps camponoti-floridani]|uniref:Palmitoyltransferase PFA4 n=1 Tax=Ophiocordyceps camponoti-floridani TaxID=2030778 RepID=A0A8H4Q7W3_9HYPO|nr:Palmitoyltransferase PFA4 [Ophiocordyceps camponoti-floridani]